MKSIIASFTTVLLLVSFQAHAGHEVGNGGLTTWVCEGHASLLDKNGGRAIMPFEMRLEKKKMDVMILNSDLKVVLQKEMVLGSAIYYKATGIVEIRSFKDSTSLTKETQAFAILRKVGQTMSEPILGTLEVKMNDNITLSSHSMKCQDYF